MKKNLLCTALGLMGIMGILVMGVVNAETRVIPGEHEISYTLNKGFSTESGFTAGTLTITDCDAESPTEDCTTITILDRNLGATATGGEEAYGYHFQWGNNYGFNPTDETIKTNAKSVSSDGVVWSGTYDNSGYYGTTFIKSEAGHGYDYWEDSTSSSSNHENLRGGGGDYNDTNNGFGKNNEKRRGPCPEGFHVPSYGELQKLQNMLNADGKRNKDTLHDKLLIPFAGLRDANNASVNDMSGYAHLWSSSPYSASSPTSRRLTLTVDGWGGMTASSRANAYSVRCFYDKYEIPTYFTVTFDSNESNDTVDAQTVRSGSKATEPLDKPTKSHAIFSGWYTDMELSNRFGFDTAITGNITLYAKYDCEDGYYPLNNGYACFTFETIYIDNPDDPGYGITIMDRNLGAQGLGLGKKSFGYYYQWGNNYGFDWVNLNSRQQAKYKTTTKAEWKDEYNNNGYYGTRMIKAAGGIADYWSDGIKHNGLWGGENDNEENNRGYDLENHDDRQGPCPNGWHVPSIGEWGMLMKFYRDNYATGVILSGDEPIFNVNDSDFFSGFNEYFKLEMSSRIYGDSFTYDVRVDGRMARYWSSSPYVDIEGDSSANLARSSFLGFNKNTSGIAAYKATNGDGVRGNAFPIRCFKNLEKFTVTFDTKGGGEIDSQVIKSGYMVQEPPQPEKEGYTFDYRYVEGAEDDEFDFSSPITSDITLCAHWTKIKKPGWSGGGGTTVVPENPDEPEDKPESNPNDDGEQSDNHPDTPSSEGDKYTQELKDAYTFAYENGITTQEPIDNANLDGSLTRIAMAKMLSKYAMNVLGLKPDTSRVNKFNDVSDALDAQYDDGVTLAYQLGIMGINMPNNEFRPYDLVPRSEFVTALSRMRYGTPDGIYEGTWEFYRNHMELLSKLGIVTVLDPSMIEVRGYVMLMLMRTDS